MHRMTATSSSPFAAASTSGARGAPPTLSRLASSPYPPGSGRKQAILYSTGRSATVAAATLEPTYPWDYDLDNDDLDDDDDYDDEDDDDDLAGEHYMVNEEDEDYQHPSLETSRPSIFLLLA